MNNRSLNSDVCRGETEIPKCVHLETKMDKLNTQVSKMVYLPNPRTKKGKTNEKQKQNSVKRINLVHVLT